MQVTYGTDICPVATVTDIKLFRHAGTIARGIPAVTIIETSLIVWREIQLPKTWFQMEKFGTLSLVVVKGYSEKS